MLYMLDVMYIYCNDMLCACIVVYGEVHVDKEKVSIAS